MDVGPHSIGLHAEHYAVPSPIVADLTASDSAAKGVRGMVDGDGHVATALPFPEFGTRDAKPVIPAVGETLPILLVL